MEKLGVWMVRNPAAVGVIMSALIGMSAYRLWKLGVLTGELRAALADEAFSASEALGG